jgi:RHS repeat-associated protein
LDVDGMNLTYDALGRMVEENMGSNYDEFDFTPTGAKLAFMSGQTLVKAFVSLPGGAQAVYTSSGLAYYRHKDWLGSSRLASTPTRTTFSDTALAPYGEAYAQSGTTDLNFTGMNQDVASGVYDFPAREYGAVPGRWPSPDPAGLAAVNPANPQSWNRYAYVQNDPLSFTDPQGLDCAVTVGGTFMGYIAGCGGGYSSGGGGGGGGGLFVGATVTTTTQTCTWVAYDVPPANPNDPVTIATTWVCTETQTTTPLPTASNNFQNPTPTASGSSSSSSSGGGGGPQAPTPTPPKPQPNPPPQPPSGPPSFSPNTCFALDWGSGYLGTLGVFTAFQPEAVVVTGPLGIASVVTWGIGKLGGC